MCEHAGDGAVVKQIGLIAKVAHQLVRSFLDVHAEVIDHAERTQLEPSNGRQLFVVYGPDVEVW